MRSVTLDGSRRSCHRAPDPHHQSRGQGQGRDQQPRGPIVLPYTRSEAVPRTRPGLKVFQVLEAGWRVDHAQHDGTRNLPCADADRLVPVTWVRFRHLGVGICRSMPQEQGPM